MAPPDGVPCLNMFMAGGNFTPVPVVVGTPPSVRKNFLAASTSCTSNSTWPIDIPISFGGANCALTAPAAKRAAMQRIEHTRIMFLSSVSVQKSQLLPEMVGRECHSSFLEARIHIAYEDVNCSGKRI